MNSLRRLLLFLTAFSLSEGFITLGSVAGVALTPNKVITACLLLFAMLDIMARPRGLPRNSKNFLVLAFAVSSGLSLIMSMLGGLAVGALAVYGTTFAATFLFYALVLHLTRSVRDVDALLWGLALGVALTGATALVGVGASDELRAYQRVGGLGGNFNALGLNAAVSIPLMFMLSRQRRSSVRKAILLAAGMLAVVAVVVSISRGAAVAMVGMIVLWTVRSGRIDLLRFLIPLGVLIFTVVQMAPAQYFERLGTISSEATTIGEGRTPRTAGYKQAVIAIATHPILGLGTAAFGPWAHRRNYVIPDTHFVHNTYLQVGTDQGLFGLIPFLGIILITWRDYSRVRLLRRRVGRGGGDPELQLIEQRAVFCQIAYFGMLIGILFQPYMLHKTLWFLISLSSVVMHLGRERAGQIVALDGPELGAPLSVPAQAAFELHPGR